jgi:hypothetical protein
MAVSMLAPMLAFLAPRLLLAQQADRFAAVAARMREFVDNGEIAGAVTLIAKEYRIIYLGAVGRTDMARDSKMQAGDIFSIALMTKPITAVCIAILADEGKLSFDDRLAKGAASCLQCENHQRIGRRSVGWLHSWIGDSPSRDIHLRIAGSRRTKASGWNMRETST